MPYPSNLSGVIAAAAAVLFLAFSSSQSALADAGTNYATPTALAVDGKPAAVKQPSSNKVMRVAQTAGDGWVVRQVSGPVRRQGGNGAVTVGERVAVGDRLIAGPGGRAVLVRRQDKITMSPNSDVKVGDSGRNSLFTNIIQTLGTLLFQVEKNPQQRFQVGTPYLAATVKGTTFTVTVRAEGAAVHVTDGAVQVAAQGGQRAVIVRPGQTGSVSSKPGAEVEIRKREGKRNPSKGESAPTATTEQAGNGRSGSSGSSGNANKTAASKTAAKGLARALGAGPSNFAKLTNGFAGNAQGRGETGAGVVFRDAAAANGQANGNGNGGIGNSQRRDSYPRPSVGAVASLRSNHSTVSAGNGGGNSGRSSSASSNSSSNSGRSSSAGGNSNAGRSASVKTLSNVGGSSGAGNSGRGTSPGGNSGGGSNPNVGGNSGGGGNPNVGGSGGGGSPNGGGNTGNGGNDKGKGKVFDR